jgi:hypothetical protein
MVDMHSWQQVVMEGKIEGKPKKQCKNCGMYDDCFTEECCQRLVTDEERGKVKESLLDYKQGKWKTYAKITW